MTENNTSFNPVGFNKDDIRLLWSAAFVFLLASLTISHMLTKNMLWRILGTDHSVVEVKSGREKEKVYEVLLEQEFTDKSIKDQIKALSDKESAGSGGITEKTGFHTDTPYREFIKGNTNTIQSTPQPVQSSSKVEEELFEVGILKNDPVTVSAFQPNNTQSSAVSGTLTKIPFNYRFEQDFLFRWDGSKAMTVPTKKLAGYHYFKNMLKLIENSFAPPGGGNFAYRDGAGIVAREGIMPGETKVQFLLSESGKVLDVRLMSSQGQDIVSRACLDSIRGQSFGPVPEEVKVNGLIFGINFIFPARYYR